MGQWNQRLFDELLRKKYDIAQQNADTLQQQQLAQPGIQESINATNLATARMQYGEGGQGDRNNLAIAPSRQAAIESANAATELSKFGLGVAQETRPNLIAQNKSIMDLNTATNLSETSPKVDEAYSRWKTSNLAKPEWIDTPYQKSTDFNTRGWLSRLWSGDLYNPFSLKNKEEESYAEKVKKLNESYLASPR